MGLHAAGEQFYCWEQVAQAFSSGYRVIAMDLRGHGYSQSSSEANYELKDLVMDLSAFVDELGLNGHDKFNEWTNPLVIAGVGLGAAVATQFAAANPGRVRALVLAEWAPVAEFTCFSPLKAARWDSLRSLAPFLLEMSGVKEIEDQNDQRQAALQMYKHRFRAFGGKFGLRMDNRFFANQDPDKLKEALHAAGQTVGSLILCRGANSYAVSAVDAMHAVAVCACSVAKSMTFFEADTVADPRSIPDAFIRAIEQAIKAAPKAKILGERSDVDMALKERLTRAKNELDGAVIDNYHAMMAANDVEMSSSSTNDDY